MVELVDRFSIGCRPSVRRRIRFAGFGVGQAVWHLSRSLLDTAHYSVTKHSVDGQALIPSIAVTAREYST